MADDGKLPSVDHVPSFNEGAMVKINADTPKNGIKPWILFGTRC
jgi:hypothetical protein